MMVGTKAAWRAILLRMLVDIDRWLSWGHATTEDLELRDAIREALEKRK